MDSVTSPRTRFFFVDCGNLYDKQGGRVVRATRRMRRRPAASSAAASTSSTAVNVEVLLPKINRRCLRQNKRICGQRLPTKWMQLLFGDIVLMSGEVRDRFHGMPRIFIDAEYAEIEPLEKVLSDEDDICYLEYIKTSRININIF
ncbi:hypothetical protein OROMI_031846 [Orobanche minor]